MSGFPYAKKEENSMKIRFYPLVLTVIVSMVLPIGGCLRKDPRESSRIPEITFEDNVVTIDGKYITTSDYLYVNRVDDRVVSISTSEGIFNFTADGEELSLGDVIIDSYYFESTIGARMSFQLAIKNTDIYAREYDTAAAMEILSSYEKAMDLPFILNSRGVEVICPGGDELSLGITYDYDCGALDPEYCPGEGITCYSWMRGRVGYGIPVLWRDRYSYHHWAESSLMIKNYNGKNYIWFCISYGEEDDGKIYYSAGVEEKPCSEEGSAIAGDTETSGVTYELIYFEETDGPFVCCDLNDFYGIMEKI